MRDTGKCKYEDKCHYSHDPAVVAKSKKEMNSNAQATVMSTAKEAEATAAVNAQVKGKGKGKGSGKGAGKGTKNDKDRLCGFIKRGEECSYGKDCKYSHNKKAFNDDGTKKTKSSQNQGQPKADSLRRTQKTGASRSV